MRTTYALGSISTAFSSSGEERGLLSRTAANNRAYALNIRFSEDTPMGKSCWSIPHLEDLLCFWNAYSIHKLITRNKIRISAKWNTNFTDWSNFALK